SSTAFWGSFTNSAWTSCQRPASSWLRSRLSRGVCSPSLRLVARVPPVRCSSIRPASASRPVLWSMSASPGLPYARSGVVGGSSVPVMLEAPPEVLASGRRARGCDVAHLLGEQRAIVDHGLSQLLRGARLGAMGVADGVGAAVVLHELGVVHRQV